MKQAILASPAILTGQTECQLVRVPDLSCMLHGAVVEPLAKLREAARLAGFDLAVASSFRSFERQRTIWNDKVAGRRAVLDDFGQGIDVEALDDWEKVQAILRWSALPGASRHHWGTDLDVFDRNGLSPEHPSPQLTEAECEAGGAFHAFHCWLDRSLGEHSDFYRPYAIDRGGIGREPWHVSYRPLALQYQEALDLDTLRTVVEASDIALRDTVLNHLDQIYHRYIALPAQL